MNETHLIWIFAIGFPLFFVAMWLLVTRILSRVGWSKYLPAFAWDRPIPADARRFSWATMVIGRFPGGVSYRKDRQSVVSGTSVSVRLALGGRRIIKNKSNNLNSIDDLLSSTKNNNQINTTKSARTVAK